MAHHPHTSPYDDTWQGVAIDYSGGAFTSGSLFVIDFDLTSRAASVKWLSQYGMTLTPHHATLGAPLSYPTNHYSHPTA